MKRLMIILTAIGALSAGCAGPNSNRAAGGSGQDCASCQIENPGDVSVCERICHEHESDQMGGWAGAVLR